MVRSKKFAYCYGSDSETIKRVESKVAPVARRWNPRSGERCYSVYSFAVAKWKFVFLSV